MLLDRKRLFCLGVLFSGCSILPVLPVANPDAAWITYAANPDAAYKVYTQHLDSTETKDWCPENTTCTSPQWLGQTHLLFVSKNEEKYRLLAVQTDPVDSSADAPAYQIQFESTHPILAVHATQQSHRYVFQSGPAGREQVYAGRLEHQQQTQTSGRYPQLSPNGEHIAFLQGQRICVMPFSDGTPQCLTPTGEADFYPRWSPDSQRLAYLNRQNNGWYLAYMQADGSQRKTLYTASEALTPAWSPDGESIAFVTPGRFDETEEEAPLQDPEQSLWMLRLDGLQAEPLMTGRGYSSPFWSAEGKQLIFQSTQTGSSNIYRLDIQSKALTPITRTDDTHLLGDVK